MPRVLTRHRRRAAVAALAVALLAATGCSRSTAEPNLAKDGGADVGDLPAVPGFDGATIHVGVLVPSSGPQAEAAAVRATGVKAYLDYITTELGGIGGKYAIDLEVRDSADPAKLQQRYAELRDATVLLADVGGRDAVRTLLPAIVRDGVVAAPGRSDVAWEHEPNLIPVGTPDQLAGANALGWLVGAGGGKDPGAHLCSALQERSDGDAWQDGLQRAATKLGVTVDAPVVIPAAPKAPKGVQPQVDQLVAAGCTAVLLSASSSTTTAVLTAASAASYAPRWVVSGATLPGPLVDEGLRSYVADHLSVVSDGPVTEEPAGEPELARIRDAYAPEQVASGEFTTGYLQGKAIVAVLDAAVSRGDLSRPSVLELAGRVRSVHFDDLAADADLGSPATRTAPTTSTISVPDLRSRTRLRPVAIATSVPFASELLSDLSTP